MSGKVTMRTQNLGTCPLGRPHWIVGRRPTSVERFIITARCTLVQSAVLRSHVVCLSVYPSVRPSVTLVNC